MSNIENYSDFLFYQSKDGNVRVQIIVDGENETVWASQKAMAEIFGCSADNVGLHLRNIFSDNELDINSVTEKISATAADGKKYPTNFYNLDAIIAVGYRVNSYKATDFRKWATGILKEYLIKGFAMDDERLKQGKNMFGKDYFNELIERIREIRASERRFYQKITDIYAQCSLDYNPKSPITQKFYATVQNKLEFAITHKTAAEIIKSRANSLKPNMGLQTWKNSKTGGKILKSDVTVAKNYLLENEISELNKVVTMYLDYAELQAERQKAMTMDEWVKKLNAFLQFNEYDILNDAGKIRKDIADNFAESEFVKFRPIQDREFESDFDKTIKHIKTTGKLPKKDEEIIDTLTEFNKNLKKALDFKHK